MNTKISPYTRSLNLALSVIEELGGLQREMQKDASQGEGNVTTMTGQRLVEALSEAFPGDVISIEGEQVWGGEADAFRRWVIVPLDGESNYYRGTTSYSICLTLEERGYNDQFEAVLGIVHAPALDLTYCAIRGEGSWCNGKRFSLNDREVGWELVGESTGCLALDTLASGDTPSERPETGSALILSEAVEWDERVSIAEAISAPSPVEVV